MGALAAPRCRRQGTPQGPWRAEPEREIRGVQVGPQQEAGCVGARGDLEGAVAQRSCVSRAVGGEGPEAGWAAGLQR